MSHNFVRGKMRYGFAVVVLLVGILVFSGQGLAYTDTQNHWARQDVELLSAKGIVGGYSDGRFLPNQNVTRAEFSKMMISSLGLDEEAYRLYQIPSVFRDVSANHWAKGYIELAYELGIIRGYDDRTFRSEQPLRRDELTAMVVRALQLPSGLEVPTGQRFTDEARIPDWVKDSVEKALILGIIEGYPDGSFRAEARTTRAQAAAFMVRMLQLRGGALEFAGTLQGIDSSLQRMRVEIQGEDLLFRYLQPLPLYREGERLELDALSSTLPEKVQFILNGDGEICYLELVDQLAESPWNTYAELPALAVSDEKDSAQRLMNFINQEYQGGQPGKSLEVTKGELGLSELVTASGPFGTGQIIAIIDTGVDPGHPDLQKTTRDEPKIVDWVDFTDELKIVMKGTLRAEGNRNYTIDGNTYQLHDIPSKSGYYRYGFINEGQIFKDVNFNGRFDDQFLVILTDPDTAGVYSTVYIDVDKNRSITAQKGIKRYGVAKEYFSLASADPQRHFNFVVGGIAQDGSWVRLGTDLNGHGTHVAGIASGNGQVKGVAPGSQVMVLKALDTRGETNWALLKEAILYAANNGAHIINLSLGYYQDDTAGNNSLTELIARITREYNIVFTVATGNRGPGLASLATPGNAKAALSVGAFISPAMWKQDYNFTVEHDSLWYFSSIGPREDGWMIPDVVAPGSAVSTSPMWAMNRYSLAEGTSMAAPHVAGAVAVLRDSMARLGRASDAQDIHRAISLGARPLENFGPAEVGAGVINVVEAWRTLFLVDRVEPLTTQTYNRRLAFGEGLYARDFIPGKIDFRVQNHSAEPVTITWDATVPWLQPLLSTTRIGAEGSRQLPVHYAIPQEPGLYSGFLRGDITNTYGYDVKTLVTVVRPYVFSPEKQYAIQLHDTLPAAQWARYFFEVPPGTSSLDLRLQIGLHGVTPAGRVRGHLIDPRGNEYYMTEYVGLGPPGALVRDQVNGSIISPETGVWEIVIYSSPALSDYGLKTSEYELEVQAKGLEKQENPVAAKPSWILGYVPGAENPYGSLGSTLHFVDRNTKRPIHGVVELDGKVYEVRQGMLFLP